MKISELGEFGLIDRITKICKDPKVLIGIGDDAAVVEQSDLQVLTTDCLVEGDHFKREWFSFLQIGKKAIEINASDVYAMGGNPKYVLVSLVLPKDTDVESIEEMYAGMRESCKIHGCEIIGGNMTHGNQLVISITLIGSVKKEYLKKRSGAKSGDLIMISGTVGKARAGLRVFQENLDKSKFPGAVKEYLEPGAKKDKARKIREYATSIIDISDGVGSEIMHICKQSGVGAKITKEAIPLSEETKKVAAAIGEDPYDYALYGGEDFELLFTVKKEDKEKVEGYSIGEVTSDRQITILSDGVEQEMKKEGYDHFLLSE